VQPDASWQGRTRFEQLRSRNRTRGNAVVLHCHGETSAPNRLSYGKVGDAWVAERALRIEVPVRRNSCVWADATAHQFYVESTLVIRTGLVGPKNGVITSCRYTVYNDVWGVWRRYFFFCRSLIKTLILNPKLSCDIQTKQCTANIFVDVVLHNSCL
jgi:hypothetical protein